MTPLLAVVAAALAAGVVLAPSAEARLGTLRGPRDGVRLGEVTWGVPVIGAVVGLLATGGPVGAVPGALLGLGVRREWARRRAERAKDRVREALPDVLRLIAAELAAGAAPHDALLASATAAPPVLAGHLRAVAAGARLGLPPADTLVPGPPGAERLIALAACWRVSASTGAGLAEGVSRLAAGLSAEARCRAEVAAQLAGPRATAAVLFALPALAVLMGAGLGASPLAFFRTPAGAICLTAGLALDAAGLLWTRRIATSAVS